MATFSKDALNLDYAKEVQIIKAGGNRISAKEIEDVVLEISGVLETAVIGVPDDLLGEAIKVFAVRCHATLTEDEVKSHLQRRLPSFKHPKWVEFVDELPKNQSGKILKAVLRQTITNSQLPPAQTLQIN